MHYALCITKETRMPIMHLCMVHYKKNANGNYAFVHGALCIIKIL